MLISGWIVSIRWSRSVETHLMAERERIPTSKLRYTTQMAWVMRDFLSEIAPCPGWTKEKSLLSAKLFWVHQGSRGEWQDPVHGEPEFRSACWREFKHPLDVHIWKLFEDNGWIPQLVLLNTLPKTNTAPWKRWLGGYFPFGMAFFRGYVIFKESIIWFHGITGNCNT